MPQLLQIITVYNKVSLPGSGALKVVLKVVLSGGLLALPPTMQLSTTNNLQFAGRLLPIDCCPTEGALGRCWALTFRPHCPRPLIRLLWAISNILVAQLWKRVRRPCGVGMVPQMNKDNAASQTTLSNFIMLTCWCFSGCVCVGLIWGGMIAADRQQWSIWWVGQLFV